METLVLTASYEPVARVTWKRAITLLFEGKVEVIEEYQDRLIRSVTFEIKMPSVIRFLRAMRARKKTPKFSRENVYARDNGRCQYCRKKVPRQEATYDHVTPRARGGKTTWENVVIACVPCNQHKGARTVAEAGLQLRSTPSRPKKLPDVVRITITFQKGMPHSWKSWLRDYSYWNGELENDNDNGE
jgi:5-methylcytosine-specific restriction endonuclease McrA